MPTPENSTGDRQHRGLVSPPRFQFSLTWLLIAVTVVALILGFGASLRYMLSYAILCVLLTPVFIGAIFGRGYLRAFAIGALVPWLAHIQGGSMFTLTVTAILATATLSALCGGIAVVSWRWVRVTNPEP